MSVIIPLYNYSRYVVETIRSVYAQEYDGKIETIVVDDRSTDNSVIFIKLKFKKHMPIIIQHPMNKGYSAAKNTGIRASTGEFIVLIDADDMLAPDSIKNRAQYLIDHPEVDMIRGTVYNIDEFGGYNYYLKRLYKLKVYGKRKVQAQTTMLRRSVHTRFGLYDERLRSRSDNEMWNRLDLYGEFGEPKINCHFLKEPPVAFYRRHKRSMIEYRRRNPSYNKEMTRILEDAKLMRRTEGITRENTPWLKR